MYFKDQLKEDLTNYLIINLNNAGDEEEIDGLLDEFNEDMLAVLSTRYSIKNDPVPKSLEWFVNVLPALDDRRFKSILRASRPQFQLILSLIEDSPVFPAPNKLKYPISMQLAIAMYQFGSYGDGATTAKVAALFGVGDGGTIHRFTSRIINALLLLESKYVSWPSPEERLVLEQATESELPLCVGYLDGSEIKLAYTPALDHTSYFSRKQQYSLKLQAVCDRDLKIRHILVGYPGSVHDARIFNSSDFAKNPTNYFTEPQYLAADSAYKLTTTVITPFRKNSTFSNSKTRKLFNRIFSKYRVKIEHCFGILKNKFPSLKQLRIKINDKKTHIEACNWIRACIILHNIMLPTYEEEDLELEFEESDDDEEIQGTCSDRAATEKRSELVQSILQKHSE